MKIYNVYQSGKRLYIDEKENPDNKIVVNKYDNMQQTLRLISDGTLPPRLYWALRNPKLSQKYFILKLINNEDLIVGTDISATHGLWDMLLIGTDEDYIIEGIDIDQSRLTYVSDHFGRLFVRDNFLEELDFEEQCSPTFRVFYDEIIFQLGNKADTKDIPDKLSDLENDTNFISGVALKDDGEGHVEIIGTTFSGGETEEGETPSVDNIEVDDGLDEESTNPVQNKVVTKEIKTLKDKDESLDKKILTLREENEALEQKNTQLKETIEKLQIKVTTEKASFHNIKDSANMKVVDFGMEGKTTQDGTPTPENQVEIVNAGVYNEATGRYEHKFYAGNKNLLKLTGRNVLPEQESASTVAREFTGNQIFVGISANNYMQQRVVKNYSIDNDSITLTTSGGSFGLGFDVPVKEGQTYIISDDNNNVNIKVGFFDSEGNYLSYLTLVGKSFTIPTGASWLIVVFLSATTTETNITNIQLELDTVATEPVIHQSTKFTLTSPVPLTKWDYLTKRDGVWGWSINSRIYAFTGGEPVSIGTDYYITGASTAGFIYLPNKKSRQQDDIQYDYIDRLSFVPGIWGKTDGSVGFYSISNYTIMRFRNEDMGITDDMSKQDKITRFQLYLKSLYENGNPVIITYETDTEQSFHPLLEEEQTLLNNLETYYGVTNLYNDQGCPTWLTYIVDNQLYIDNKVQQINNALLSLGANV